LSASATPVLPQAWQDRVPQPHRSLAMSYNHVPPLLG